MLNPDISELILRVKELTDATRKGLLQWRIVNPTTHLWERPPKISSPGAKMTLQRVDHSATERSPEGRPRVVRKTFYILQVFEIELVGATLRLSIVGSENPNLNAALEELFTTISSGVSELGMDFLKSLIPKNDTPS